MLIVISYTSYHHATHSYISTCYTSNWCVFGFFVEGYSLFMKNILKIFHQGNKINDRYSQIDVYLIVSF